VATPIVTSDISHNSINSIKYVNSDGNMIDEICSLCGSTTNEKKVVFRHVRLSLDEAPERVMRRCKLMLRYLKLVEDKVVETKISEGDEICCNIVAKLIEPVDAVSIDHLARSCTPELVFRH